MMEGSVRIVTPSIQENLFWGMVTSDGGELVAE